jgi:hypothetical protein
VSAAPRFKAGERVVHVTGGVSSAIPEGVKGTVLGPSEPYFRGKWEVEYDGHPCRHFGRAEAYPLFKSTTSWISRDEAIELTVESVRAREAESLASALE